MDINFLLFNDFETLDVFGAVEVFGFIEEYRLRFFSVSGGIVKSTQNAPILTENIGAINPKGLLMIPGGKGTRTLVDDETFINLLTTLARDAAWCLTICTGSALLAKTGLLDHRKATSNKRAFEWVKTQGKNVDWQEKARWVVDKKIYTSSGISAGIDMSLGFIADRFGETKARDIAQRMEYVWGGDSGVGDGLARPA